MNIFKKSPWINDRLFLIIISALFPVSCSADVLSELPDEIDRFPCCVMFRWVYLCRLFLFHFPGLHYYLNHTQAHKHKEKEENYLLYLQMSVIHTKKKKRNESKNKNDKRAKTKVLSILASNLKMHISKSQEVLSNTMAKNFSPEDIQAKMLMSAGTIL